TLPKTPGPTTRRSRLAGLPAAAEGDVDDAAGAVAETMTSLVTELDALLVGCKNASAPAEVATAAMAVAPAQRREMEGVEAEANGGGRVLRVKVKLRDLRATDDRPARRVIVSSASRGIVLI
ncbi:hypothetical protein Vafri_18325, partial [Volvox africanus]